MTVDMVAAAGRTKVSFIIPGARPTHRPLMDNFFSLCGALSPDLVSGVEMRVFANGPGAELTFHDVCPGAGLPVGALSLHPRTTGEWEVVYDSSDHVPAGYKAVNLGAVRLAMAEADTGRRTEVSLEFESQAIDTMPGLASRVPVLIVRKLMERVRHFTIKELTANQEIHTNVVDSAGR